MILIRIDGGSYFRPDGLIFDKKTSSNGQDFLPSNFSVRGLSLVGFSNAIRIIAADSVSLGGNFIGILPDGKTETANNVAVALTNAAVAGNAIIGGN